MMDTDQFIQYLTGITDLSAPFVAELEKALRTEKYKPRQIIHAAGQLENRVMFISTGFVRKYYYDHRGNDHTVRFWEEGEIVFSYEGNYNVPCYFYTEIIQETEAYTLSYQAIHEMEPLFPEMAILIRYFLLRYQQEEYAYQQLIALSAAERFQTLMLTRKQLFQRASARIIASYLNMTRENLTRLIGKN